MEYNHIWLSGVLHTTWYLLTGVSEVPDVRFVGSAQNVTEAEGMMTVCVVSGQLAEEITPVNATISTQAGSAKGQQSHSRCPYVLYQYYLSILASSPGPSHIYFISLPWRKIGRRPGIKTTSRTGNGRLG